MVFDQRKTLKNVILSMFKTASFDQTYLLDHTKYSHEIRWVTHSQKQISTPASRLKEVRAKQFSPISSPKRGKHQHDSVDILTVMLISVSAWPTPVI